MDLPAHRPTGPRSRPLLGQVLAAASLEPDRITQLLDGIDARLYTWRLELSPPPISHTGGFDDVPRRELGVNIYAMPENTAEFDVDWADDAIHKISIPNATLRQQLVWACDAEAVEREESIDLSAR